ncbi:MAG: MarC family protein [Proteobacteria bacterium]|nr:MarC family protein [Pseudomonadota bacterium]
MFANSFFYEFVTLYVILDPVATIPVFLAVTTGLTRRRQLAVAGAACLIAFAILLFFILLGDKLLDALHVEMAAFQLAGGLVLLLFGLQMTLGKVTETALSMPADATIIHRSVFPLAMPSIAGAGSILTVMLLADNTDRTFAEQVQTTAVLVACLVALFVGFALSSVLSRLLGRGGIEIVSRVFGLILTSIAVTNLIVAIKLSFGLPMPAT